MLRKMGIAESEIASSRRRHGEAYMMANVCSEPFFRPEDGDLTPAFARRIVDMQIETDAGTDDRCDRHNP